MPRTVLVVDDNESIHRALCTVFTSQAAFDVCGEAENGQQAIEKAKELHPDVIVMDLSMPVMNGIEAGRVLKELNKRLQAMSQSTESQAERQAIENALASLRTLKREKLDFPDWEKK
jgi:chemotaxis response regulator CheB